MEEIGNAKSDLMDPNAVRAPPTDAELKIAALQGMFVKKLKKIEKSEGAVREWSTVVIVTVIFISCFLF